ncbi:MAG: VCBS repeat-containing protein, partial [Polyangiaceae bacterium]|nr:VCBS repeat-containing protein [Polyangiaceae bacterium]
MRSSSISSVGRVLFALALLGIAAPAEAAPYFQEVVNPFGVQPCGGSGCWTNYLRVSDIDGDNDLDVVIPNATGFFSKGASAQPLVVYTNDGAGAFTDVSASAVGGYSNWIRQVALGDVDLDGDVDMYVPSGWNDPDKFFINDGKGIFTDELAARLPNQASKAGATRFGDVDNDGDLDLFIGGDWAAQNLQPPIARLFLNDGAGVFTESPAKLPTTKKGNQPDDFDLLDADGDFDLDLLITMHVGTSSLWLNDGKGGFTDAPLPMQGNAFKYGPVACDVDGDKDLDIWFDNAGPNYTEQLFINNGDGTFTDETAARVSGNPGSDDNGVACIDIDGDGDFDAAIMSLSGNERVLLNDGTGKFTLIADAFPVLKDPTLWFEFGDLNGDGRLDVVTGQGEGNPQLNRVYIGTDTAPVDIVPPTLRAVEKAPATVMTGTEIGLRFGVSDNATTDEGPRLEKAYVEVTTNDSKTEIPALFMGGDLFRAVLPAQSAAGEVSYAACAVDKQGNKGCSPTSTYIVEAGSSGNGGAGGGGSGGAGGN